MNSMSSPQAAVAVREIRAGLARNGQTQEHLASHLRDAKFRISRTGIYRRLVGEVDFSVSELVEVAAFLKVPVAALLTPTAPSSAAPRLDEGAFSSPVDSALTPESAGAFLAPERKAG